mmetsp:Transcript_15612/g.26615  ORF Transcript_15612/g.26615 Transcript_15612/m.26615 type:complete len:218 (-) Transcript_15612:286-939(-)
MSNELIKEECSIQWSTTRLGVELHTKEWLVNVHNTLIRQIIRIHEELLPFTGETVGINSESMVLGCNVAPTRAQINTRLVHTTVSVLKFVCLGSSRKSEELVPQTDTKDWTRWFELQCILDTFNCFGAHAWISWSVGEEETIPLNVGGVGFQIVVEWNDCEFDFVCVNEVADDVKFHTAIVGDDGGSVLFTVYLNFFCGDFFGEVTFVGIGEHVGFD